MLSIESVLQPAVLMSLRPMATSLCLPSVVRDGRGLRS